MYVAMDRVPQKTTQNGLNHIQHYSKLKKNVRVTQSQNVPSSSLSQPVADRQAEAGWRDKLGLGYASALHDPKK